MLIRRYFAVALVSVFVVCGGVPPLQGSEPPVANLAHIKLAGSLDEAPVSEEPFFGGSTENLKAKLERIQKAKEDAKIQGLLLQIDGLDVGWGKLHELHRAIADFRKSGKKAYAYLQSGGSKDYLLAIACDQVCAPEAGWLMLTGLQGEVSFYKDLLDKIGVKADLLQMGVYKGAAEPFTRSTMSKPFRERLESVLDDYYENELVHQIVASRAAKKLTPGAVKHLIDKGPYTAKAAATAGLIDRVAYLDHFSASLKTELKVARVKVVKDYGRKKLEEIDFSDFFSILKLFKSTKAGKSKGTKIAVIYATGIIVTGKSSESFMGESTTGSATMIAAVRQAEKDDTVKAIVLRVDSPGGSALASDLIWNELRKCKKPVVASMSDVAASGGYYISMAARKIYAEPGTLTGSIGVVGGKIVLAGLYDKIGLKTEVIRRGANAGILSTNSPFSKSQRQAMKALMKDVYDQFVNKAIQGRINAGKKFTRTDFSMFAEGRIWTGRQAKVNGLVDELGTLSDAVQAAQVMAGLDKHAPVELLVLPKPRSFFEMLMDPSSGARAPRIMPMPFPGLRVFPEVASQLRAAAGLLQLRTEPVWAILPCRIAVH